MIKIFSYTQICITFLQLISFNNRQTREAQKILRVCGIIQYKPRGSLGHNDDSHGTVSNGKLRYKYYSIDGTMKLKKGIDR